MRSGNSGKVILNWEEKVWVLKQHNKASQQT
jgi:hypothetical protein